MTEYAGFYRPGEVTLLLQPADANKVGVDIKTVDLALVQQLLKRAGVDLHTTQGQGHAGPREPVVLRHRDDARHIVHTVNLASWISPETQSQMDKQRKLEERRQSDGNVLGRTVFSAIYRARDLAGNVLQRGKPDPAQQSLTDVLDAVAKLNDPNNAEFLRRGDFRVVAATPNWLATPAQTF